MSYAELSLKSIDFDPSTIEHIIDQLRRVTKIKFECYKRDFLERRIKARMYRLNISSDKDYLEHVCKNPAEFNEFSDLFTINYTYFFRNNEVYQQLKNLFLSNKAKIQNPDLIRIWSAACSTGEEPYSIAMLFEYLKKIKIKVPDLEIVASDLDSKALQMAKRGVYCEYSVHDLPDIYRPFFKSKSTAYGLQYKISKKIKEKVIFIEEDLTSKHAINHKYDVIFCRNILIYLNKYFQQKVFQNLANHLIQGGILVLGKTEMIMKSGGSQFKLIDPKNHIYMKI
ncbi:MAG: protein-glutamate O-methyltransferase CheR [Candidatus Lokiarchaeota archaeon]|nr:protein-glutamate O-methyltransferase CheR [Candidatus Lokiarchaeota archaeon]